MHLRARGRGVVAVAAVAVGLFVATRGRAQDDGTSIGGSGAKIVPAPSGSTAGPVMVPPKVKVFVEPVYPPERLAKGERAEVVVSLVIDATGKVTDAKIVTSAGDDFDAAALEAAKKLEFEPATADGKPIPAKIAKYRFKFDFKEVSTPLPTTGGSGYAPGGTTLNVKKQPLLTGRVKSPADDPIPGVTVTARATTGAVYSAVTDATGAFSFFNLPDGKYQIGIEIPGFLPFVTEETVQQGFVSDVVYRPTLAGEGVDILVTGEKPPREVVKRQLEQREITRIPGTNGDALRAIQNLPGVARPPGFAGLLIIRGSSPFDTNVFVDGTLIPLAYHFGGLSSVVPSELLEKIDFYPGNFGPEYGRVMGGIVDVGIRSPNKTEYHGLLQFDLLDARIVAEGPIDKKTRFAIAGRRSWVDVWLKPVLEKTGTGVSTAPVYYDYQVMVERDVTASTTARLLLFGSDDRLAITLNSPSSADPTLGGDIHAHTAFWRLQARAETRVTKDVRWVNTLAYGTDYADFAVGDYFFRLVGHPLTLRSDVRAKVSNEASVIVGVDTLWSSYDVAFKFPPLPVAGEAAGPFFARPANELNGKGSLYRPAAYAMLDLAPVKSLHLLPAMRVDYSKDTGRWNVSPRFVARYDIKPGFPRTTLKGAAGIFFQPPQPQESIAPFGTPGLKSARAAHYDVGVEQEFTRQLELSVDGFFKDLSDLVVRQNVNSTANGIVYSNNGSGRVYGVEVLLRYKPDDIFFGWIAYTLSKSERRDAPDQPLRNFQYDQTHIFTILGSFRLGRGWELGGRFRYVTGSMYTPNQGGVSDFDAGSYAPVPTFPLFSGRLPAFHQADIRLDKVWKFSSWQLSAYLDVQNVYVRANPEGVTYNYNYSQRDIISGIPILPILGIRGQL
jgi:TonB family protein